MAEAQLMASSIETTANESMHPPPTNIIAPDLSDMPLHEWIARLTHPVTGPFPHGITTRMIDNLARQNRVAMFPSADRRRFHKLWKSVSHLSVHLSECTKKGRIRRIALGTFVGVFDGGKQRIHSNVLGNIGKTISKGQTSWTSAASVGLKNCQHRMVTRPMEHAKTPKRMDDMDEFGLPSLIKMNPSLKDMTAESLSNMTKDDVEQLCQNFGYNESAQAMIQEEVDGTALMLLTRQDVLTKLGLKLGPALKLHRFVRTLQLHVKEAL